MSSRQVKKQIPHHFSRKLLLFILLFWGSLTIFLKLASEVREHEPILLDGTILQLVRTWHTAKLTSFMKLITNGGSVLFIITFSLMLAFLLWIHNKWRDSAAVIIAVGGSGVANFLLKLLFQRTRPSLWPALIQENSFSFPSGHAMGSAALGIAVVLMLWRTRWHWLGLLLAAIYVPLVGLSRIYLGVHYPSDVLAGWCVSMVWVMVVYALIEHPVMIKSWAARSLRIFR